MNRKTTTVATGPPATSAPSKTALVLISQSPLALLGIDRMYVGCDTSGWVKFVFFLLVFVIGPLLGPLWPIVAIFFALWVAMDWLRVLVNALSMSKYRPFCDAATPATAWTSARDIRYAFWIGLALNVTTVAIIVILLSVALTLGLSKAWDMVRGMLHLEDRVPNSEQMSAYYTAWAPF